MLDHARRTYGVICADLTHAKNAHALEILRASDAVFIVSSSDRASLEAVREKLEWLRSIDLEESCGLLLERVPGGASICEAEELTGLPVCSLLDDASQRAQLAGWLAANARSDKAEPDHYALAG